MKPETKISKRVRFADSILPQRSTVTQCVILVKFFIWFFSLVKPALKTISKIILGKIISLILKTNYFAINQLAKFLYSFRFLIISLEYARGVQVL
jgi:hypothetical protein